MISALLTQQQRVWAQIAARVWFLASVVSRAGETA